jgi:transitional endoplasmic reticulum ATPase
MIYAEAAVGGPVWARENLEALNDDSPIGLWSARLMHHCEAWKCRLWDEDDDELPHQMRLRVDPEDTPDPGRSSSREPRHPSSDELRALIAQRLDHFRQHPPARDAQVFRNAAYLAQRVGLTPLEREIVELGACLEDARVLYSWLKRAQGRRRRGLLRSVAIAIDAPEHDVRAALNPKRILISSGIVPELRLSEPHGDTVFLAEPICAALHRECASCEDIFLSLFHEAEPAKLTVDDFPHVRSAMNLASRLIRAGAAANAAGVNVLIHGPPGTGKTALARLIAATAGVRPYEVSLDDDGGEGLSPSARLTAYSLCQRVLVQSSGTAILFDEAEESISTRRGLFLSGMHLLMGDGPRDKGWMNRLLEDNAVPSIWVTNSVHGFDPAFLRRFSFVMELRVPPNSVRRKILDRYTDGLCVSEAWKRKITADDRIGPGLIEGAARAVKLVGSVGACGTESDLSRILDGSVRSQGLRGKATAMHLGLGGWDSAFANASCDLDELASGMDRTGRGAILLYGPPGTGKSAFADHLATHLGRELIARRASDLLDMYVGNSEKNIAAMFEQAKAVEGVLLLDEADSFLQSRSSAYHRWEVTQVNELLVQMESFDGIFVCSTNLTDTLDPAVFRRFALKIRFEPLRIDQRWMLFRKTAEQLGMVVDDAVRREVERLTDLTPGDFATVVMKSLLVPIVHSRGLLLALQEERRTKPGRNREEIGFASRAECRAANVVLRAESTCRR